MNDRELLELAAKAYGLYTEPVDARDWVAPSSLPVDNYYANSGPTWGLQVVGGLWNPLDDDGDALRLAVKLYMQVECSKGYQHVSVYGRDGTFSELHNGIDPYAATRRAIVRAAAEIGKAMP